MKLWWKAASLRAGLTACVAVSGSVWGQEKSESFPDEPAAHALYTSMVETMRKAGALSWVSDYEWETEGRSLGHATYKIWLKKPNYARVEASKAGASEPCGILVGDGEQFWIYWPKEKPRYGWEDKGKYAEQYEKYRTRFYMKKRSPVGRHSIAHEVGSLGAGTAMTILDPSTFHGYTDSLQRYVDGVKALPGESVKGEPCDHIEVSIMKHQRSWELWLARKDHLPRRLRETIRVSHPIIIKEDWSEVTLEPPIPNERFVWSAPADWKQWSPPPIEEGLLKAGTQAPDFELTSTDGRKLRLSNFRGQIVWLNKWRCG